MHNWWRKKKPVESLESFERLHFPFDFLKADPHGTATDIGQIFCPVCGGTVKMKPFGPPNVRETGFCSGCGSWNRQRLTAVLLLGLIERFSGVCATHLASPEIPENLQIFNAEWFGAVHERLKRLPGYSWSRYSGGQYRSGDMVNGYPHQDLLATSFPDNHFDIVLTFDVMEHIPEPYLAHQEIYRILKPGGVHLFTVPCNLNNPLDDQRTAMVNGEIVLLSAPAWHGEQEDSNLVYNIFGTELICHLWVLGFDVKVHEMSDPEKGIIGPGSIAFEAVKHHDPIPRPVPTGLRNCS